MALWIPKSKVLIDWFVKNQHLLNDTALVILRAIDTDPIYLDIENALPLVKKVRINLEDEPSVIEIV